MKLSKMIFSPVPPIIFIDERGATQRLADELQETVNSCDERAHILRIEIENRTNELADVMRAGAVAKDALAHLQLDRELGDAVTEDTGVFRVGSTVACVGAGPWVGEDLDDATARRLNDG